jgi:hypothetical protein
MYTQMSKVLAMWCSGYSLDETMMWLPVTDTMLAGFSLWVRLHTGALATRESKWLETALVACSLVFGWIAFDMAVDQGVTQSVA